MLLLLSQPAFAGLYDGAAHVTLVRDFTTVVDGEGYMAIEFFAGWCGHCQAFAPIWKQVGDMACAAAPALRIGAVDCVADFLTCQEMGVESFPTIRVFGPALEARARSGATNLHAATMAATRQARCSRTC